MVFACLFAALGLGVAACGSDDNGGSTGGSSGSKSLTVYSSLPLQGASRPQSENVVKGEKLALEQAGGKVGDYTIKYTSLDDSTAPAGKWDPGATAANARKAAQDKSTIAYLGEFNSGASAISIPILNEAGIQQISPSNTAVGLTKSGPGADKGEPDKYYPTGKRTYARIVPIDNIQGTALGNFMKDEGVTKVYVRTTRRSTARVSRTSRGGREGCRHPGGGHRRLGRPGRELPLPRLQDQGHRR